MPKWSLIYFSITMLVPALCFSQPDTIRTKKVDHYIGVQVNELVRQIFNFSNSVSPVIDNPYLVEYSLFFGKKVWGVQGGFGCRYERITAEEANNDSKIIETFYQVGAVRKSMIGKRI